MRISSTLSGVAGEYFVAAELSKRGIIASITLRNTKGVDILASSEKENRQVSIQVKTNQNRKREWLLSKSAETSKEDSFYYVFVNLHSESEHPEYFIVPSRIVADYTKKFHQEWLDTPGKKGQPHKDNSMRKFRDEEGLYLNKWKILGI